ncbi:hypothetical protein KAR91_17985 [Candidatus Pacearchaeota archaeon]|nr:hypothetical protein [Candidatus Pacearchaeota archaeon]
MEERNEDPAFEDFVNLSEKQDEISDESDIPECENRKTQWMDNAEIETELVNIYSEVISGFEDKDEQTQVIERAYDIYNCVLNENQMYIGDSKVFLPIVHDAIEARVTRFSSALFPHTGRYSEVLSNDGEVPYETMAVLDHYVEQCKLRDLIIPTVIRSGDITGQYSLFVSWLKRDRHTIKKVPVLDEMGGVTDITDMVAETVDDSRPDVMVLDARDLLVLPASVDEVDDADTVAVTLRMSKGRIQEMIDNEEFEKKPGEEIIKNMQQYEEKKEDADEKNLNAAGIKIDSKGNVTALIYMIWTKLVLDGKRRRCVAYMTSESNILSCKRNPYWSDRVPIITQAALKLSGSIWGKSRVEPVEKAQYGANDAFNMGQDSIKYALMPITIVDPERFQKMASVIMTMGAVWPGDPAAVKIVEFPSQWAEAERVVEVCRSQILQSLDTSPAMISMGNAGKRPTAAQISQEQQVSMETTADVVTILESTILNELLRWFYELDYQYRDKDMFVRRFGPVGLQAEMQAIPPMGVDTHYTFKWYGTEGVKSAQQIQQMISLLNVMKSLPPEMLNGRKIDAGPIIEQAANSTFGPRIAPKVLIDQTHMLTIPPEDENDMMLAGFVVPVGPMDDDVAHTKIHAATAVESGDPHGTIRAHLQATSQAMQMKAAGAGGMAPPQQPGAPRSGGQAQAPTGAQNPPGAIHPDQMQGEMPRDRGGAI